MELTPTQFADSRFASKRESFAILQELATFRNNGAVESQPVETVAIDISLRRGRIALCTVGMVGIIATLVLFFREGYEIRHYEKTELNSTTQKKLLDDYNSYSGNIASVFGKPIELFVPACIQVIMLRFLSSSLLRNEPSWKAASLALAVSAGVGYLINNGFNALNVQLVDSAIHPKIKATDLSRDDTITTAGVDWMVRTTSISNSMSEAQVSNPITNTVLRSLVLPRAIRTKSNCASSSTYMVMTEHLALETVEYGFPKRDWMKQLLPQALPAKSLQLMLNATNKSANKGLKAEDLPMNASIASNLALTAMILSKDFIPLVGDWYDPNGNMYKKSTVPSAVRVGILPKDLSTSDTEQKKWFLDHVGDFLTSAFNTTTNMTLANIPMNFSHVDIAPNISFDAVTLEIDVEPLLLANFVNKKTGDRYMNSALESAAFSDLGPSFSCDPWPARCIFQKKDPALKSDTVVDVIHYDPAHQIQAFSICLNSNGTELMESMLGSYLAFSINPEQCARTSTTSMLLVSVGKRLVVDQLIQNATANATGIYPEGVFPGRGDVAVNVRKIYSFTVGRLEWNTSNLAEEFGAKCDAGEEDNCEGLALKLTASATGGVATAPQWLVASTAALPMDALMQPVLNSGDYRHSRIQRPLTLVQVNEPPRQPKTLYWYDVAAGDILHPHNVRNLTWDLSQNRPKTMCAVQEERVQRVLDNHMYIEHPLQATYTSAVFFLLQNAVVKNAVVVKRGTTSVSTLAFDGNEQRVALVASIPTDNAALTLMGCIILSIGVATSLVWATIVRSSPHRQNSLTGITNAEVIARAKLDDKTFPGFFLERRLASGGDKTAMPRVLDTLVINSLALQPPEPVLETQATKDFASVPETTAHTTIHL